MDGVMRALADPTRREILRMLRGASMSAGAIARAFSISRPAVSRHLRVLREAGLVADEARGRERVYTLDLAPVGEIEAFLLELRDDPRAGWERRFMALDTEVHRVRAESERARTKSEDGPKKETG